MQIVRTNFFFFLTLVTLSTTSIAQAKDLFGRLGIGYNAQFTSTAVTNGAPAISIKYGIAPRSMIELVAGYYSGTNGSGVAALKYMQDIHSESYANFYSLFGLGHVTVAEKSGTEILAGLGSEFFIPGVDRVGFTFETGLSAEDISSGSGSFVLKTFGVSFIHAGMHFYF